MKNKINFKKLSSKLLVFGLPLVLVGTLLVAYIVGINKSSENIDNTPVVGETSKVKRKIYLKNSDGLLVPLTITVEPSENKTDEIKNLIALLRKNSEVSEKYEGLLDEKVELLDISLQNNILTLNFNEAFNSYDTKDEIRIIEALVWTCSQYREISQIKIQVDGVELTKMPLGKCPIPKVLDMSFGINNHIFSSKSNKDNVTVYFEEVSSEETMYVPVTLRVDEKNDEIEEIVSALEENIPVYTGLKKAKVLAKIEFSNLPSLLEGVVNVDLAASSLVDESTIDKDVYEYLVMSFRDNISEVETVNVSVDNEIMSVNGYKDEVISVSSVYENVIGI